MSQQATMSQRVLMAQAEVRSCSCSASNNTEAIWCKPSSSANSEISSHEALRSMAAAVLPPLANPCGLPEETSRLRSHHLSPPLDPPAMLPVRLRTAPEANLWKPSASASSEISSRMGARSIAAAVRLLSGRSSRNDWSSCSIFFISTKDTPE